MRTEPDGPEISDGRVVPERDDEGKDVVDANGRDLGMVTTVVGNTMYADPNTTLSESVERTLGWHDERSTDLPVPADLLVRIDQEVVLAVVREAASEGEGPSSVSRPPDPSTVESDGEYVHVRYCDPDAFESLHSPEWAEKAAESVVAGGELRVGERPDGDGWTPVSVLVPEPADPEEARRQADEILQRVEH